LVVITMHCWHLEVNTKQEILRKRSLDYSKADITSLKWELSKIDWDVSLRNLTGDESWTVFRDKLTYLEEKFFQRRCQVNAETNHSG